MSNHVQILIIDDEEPIRRLHSSLIQHQDNVIHLAATGAEAREIAQNNEIALALVDIGLPDISGLELISQLKSDNPNTQTIVITGESSYDGAVQAVKLGAYNYLAKPVQAGDLKLTVRRAIERYQDLVANQRLMASIRHHKQLNEQTQPVLASPGLKRVYQSAAQAARMTASILITGETGVGKEVLASFIHSNSKRPDGPFNVLNCAALPEGLIDSELFGHVKGAFTGANADRPGIIEASNGGTLLLDEIGDIDPSTQARLLRVLETGLIRRVGSSKETPVDVRLIAATHRNLAQMVEENRFRADLFHRLVVIHLTIPPLRERKQDIVPLAKKFLSQIGQKNDQPIELAASSHQVLKNHPWPGNVRELRNAIERGWFACQCNDATHLASQHLQFLQGVASPTARETKTGKQTPLRRNDEWPSLAEIQDRYFKQVMKHCHNNRREAAAILGMSERNLYRKLQGSKQGDHDNRS